MLIKLLKKDKAVHLWYVDEIHRIEKCETMFIYFRNTWRLHTIVYFIC